MAVMQFVKTNCVILKEEVKLKWTIESLWYSHHRGKLKKLLKMKNARMHQNILIINWILGCFGKYIIAKRKKWVYHQQVLYTENF